MSFFFEEYIVILTLLFISLLISFIILGASFFLGIQKPDTEKVSIYECGFDPYEDSRNKVDIRFYLIAIIFLIFDLETMYLFPWAVSLSEINSFGFWTMIDFLLELIVGYIYIWKIGGLEWI